MSPRSAQRRRRAGAHLALIPPGASPEQAAAIVAALEQFAHDSVRALRAPAAEGDGWARAALQEGCGREPGELLRDPWINT